MKKIYTESHPIPENFGLIEMVNRFSRDYELRVVKLGYICEGPVLCCGFHGEKEGNVLSKSYGEWFTIFVGLDSDSSYDEFKSIQTTSLQMCFDCVEKWLGEDTIAQIKTERRLLNS